MIAMIAIIAGIANGVRSNKTKQKFGVNAIVFGVVIGLIGWFTVPHGSAPAQTSKPAATSPTQTTSAHVQAGDNAVINTAEDLVATSKVSFTELQNDVNANNTQDVQNMVNNGMVLQLSKGTKVYVEEVSFEGVAKIRISDGTYQEKEGYVPTEYLAKTK